MRTLKLKHLVGIQLTTLSQITVTEDGQRYTLDDTFLLTTATSKQYQLRRTPAGLFLYKIENLRDLKCWDFNHDEIQIELKTIHEIANPNPIKIIYNYTSNYYLFGSQYCDAQGRFIVGFCFGWDEIELKTETEFQSMLNMYPGHTIEEFTKT